MRTIDRVIIIHGIGTNPHIMWFPWLRRKLKKRGLHVDALTMPHPFRPDYAEWKKAARTAFKDAGPSTMVVGHSLGGTLAVRLLEEGVTKRLGCLLLVSAPIARTLKFDPVAPFFDKALDWGAVRKRAKKILLLHAKNDPVVPYDHAVRYAEHLHVQPKLVEKGGHFDGATNPELLAMMEPFLRR